jgi:hypothetical protein
VTRRDLLAHAALFAIVNAVYLVALWPEWLWVSALWGAGLLVHIVLVVRARGHQGEGSRYG